MKKIIVGLAITTVTSSILYYILFLNHITPNEVGVYYDSRDGKMWVQTNAGWYLTSPFVKEINFSTLPQQINLITDAKVNLVRYARYNPDHILDFIKMQGFSYTTSCAEVNILTGYVYSGNKYSFIDIVTNLNN